MNVRIVKLNCLDVVHECDRRIDRLTDKNAITIAASYDAIKMEVL